MEALKNAVKKTVVVGETYRNAISYHIALAGTANYLPHLAMVILSIRKYNPRLPFCFHFFLEDISAENLQKVRKMSQSIQAVIQVHLMNDEAFKEIVSANYPASYWYRLIMPDFLLAQTDRVLYLDGDMMCHGEVNELFAIDVDVNCVASVSTDRNAKRQCHRLGTQNYFNSGMMLFHTQHWHAQHMLDKVIEKMNWCKENLDHKGHVRGWNGLYYQDQNVLNYVCDGHLTWLSKKFNYLYVLDRHAFYKKQFVNDDYKKQVILHFAGYTKPWHAWAASYEVIKEYNELKKQSPWKDAPMIEPKGKKQYHQAARTALFFGEMTTCLSYYKKYWLNKLHLTR